jgi:hypothetical protein
MSQITEPIYELRCLIYVNGKRRIPSSFRLYERLQLQDRITILLNRRLKENGQLRDWRNRGHFVETNMIANDIHGSVKCILLNQEEYKYGVAFLPDFMEVYVGDAFEIGSRIIRKDIVTVRFKLPA